MSVALAKSSRWLSMHVKYRYTAYGLRIHSALPLPELIADRSATEADVADVIIRFGHVNHQPPEGDFTEGYVCTLPEGAYIFVEQVGAILTRAGNEIVVMPDPDVEERVLRLFLLGPALGLILHQRKLLTLHASAVAVAGSAVIFLGRSGEGKSTMAAALHARGHALVTDDVVALDQGGIRAPAVLPGFPQIKLWPDTAAALGNAPEILPRLHPDLEKRAQRVGHDFPQCALPVSRIYVLTEGAQFRTEILSAQQAFAYLMQHSYAVGLLGPTGATPDHFRQCVEFARRVSVYRMERPRSLELLPIVAQLVEQELIESVRPTTLAACVGVDQR
jgi:hypothetical protein